MTVKTLVMLVCYREAVTSAVRRRQRCLVEIVIAVVDDQTSEVAEVAFSSTAMEVQPVAAQLLLLLPAVVEVVVVRALLPLAVNALEAVDGARQTPAGTSRLGSPFNNSL